MTTNTSIIRRVNDIEPVPAIAFTVTVDGKQAQACAGETVLNLFFALDIRSISITNRGLKGGAYCGMGICFFCTVCIDGIMNQRACQSIVREGMNIQTHCNQFYEVGNHHAVRIK